MPDLHQRILDRCDDPVDLVLSPGPYAAALRAVVEPHKPSGPHRGRWAVRCLACMVPTPWPCSTVLTIARELGIEDGDRHG